MSCCCAKRKVITSDKTPQAIGPYSIGVSVGHLVYTSGQLGIDVATGSLVEGGIEAQTRQALEHLKSVLEAAGTGLDRVIKTTVFLKDIAEFGAMNAVYAEYFTSEQPARSAFQVAALPKGAAVEIEAVAVIPCDCEKDDHDCDCEKEDCCH